MCRTVVRLTCLGRPPPGHLLGVLSLSLFSFFSGTVSPRPVGSHSPGKLSGLRVRRPSSPPPASENSLVLASSPTSHDPSADLLWRDVIFHSPSAILLGLKSPKSADPCGEFLDLFSFPGHNCCPVKTLCSLWNKHVAAGLASLDAPVFRFLSGKNLTPSHLNSILVDLLPDLGVPGVNTISCHSFRAGILSISSLFPDLVSDDKIKGWGHWCSDAYQHYCRMQLGQKCTIFANIASALNKSLTLPDNTL